MSIELAHAIAPSHRDQAYQLRYRVFGVEDGYDLGAEGLNFRRYVDFWDTFATTTTYLGRVDGRVACTSRSVFENELGIPQDEQYDRPIAALRERLGDGRVTLVGRVAVEADARHRGLGSLLVQLTTSDAWCRGIPHALALINPRWSPWWEALGWQRSGEDFACTGVDHLLRLVYLDMRAAAPDRDPERAARVARDLCGPSRRHAAVARWEAFEEGEPLVEPGQRWTRAWELTHGVVERIAGDGARARLEPGDRIGVEELLAGHQARERLVARSRRVIAVPLDREDLEVDP